MLLVSSIFVAVTTTPTQLNCYGLTPVSLASTVYVRQEIPHPSIGHQHVSDSLGLPARRSQIASQGRTVKALPWEDATSESETPFRTRPWNHRLNPIGN